MNVEELSVNGPPLFVIRGATIRYNPQNGEDDTVALLISPEEGSTYVGALTLKGFTRENSGILGCNLVADESVAPGVLVVEPKR